MMRHVEFIVFLYHFMFCAFIAKYPMATKSKSIPNNIVFNNLVHKYINDNLNKIMEKGWFCSQYISFTGIAIIHYPCITQSIISGGV